ncbi:unnamed protein product [Rhizoctonia solani]|uniref:Malic enzyme n=1 Tax=Rhizoctonia solani TaxID=456999 RepID=A0A8H3AHV0_9AGAM|nr:unnamed protein product [Rhizoctonia solani]
MTDIYLDYYSSESLSSKWDTKPPIPSRGVELIPPNAIDIKSPSLGGPPAYDPSSMLHTQQKLFRQKLLYVAPLGYYAIRTLRPWCFGMDTGDGTLSSWVSISASEGEERVNLGDIIAPWAKDDISLLDPATWAFLIQQYNGLPERYSSYRLALNDPYLPMLSTISSTPNFSIVIILDLSKCDDLHDSNISRLKLLTSLCVLDTSNTHLTDQGVKNLRSTLLLPEPGPLRLKSWSLRGCVKVTSYALESLKCFPMLCLLDLRGTSISPLKPIHTLLNWDPTTILLSRDHLDFFWPQPQSRIPILIHGLEDITCPSKAEASGLDDKPKQPWIVHVDRQYPSNQGLNRRAYWKPTRPSDYLPWYSYDYSDEDEFVEEELAYGEYDAYADSGLNSNFSGTDGSGDLDLSYKEFSPSSPLEPTSSLFGDDEASISLGMDSALIDSEQNNAIHSNTPGNANGRQSPCNDLNQLAAEVIAQESQELVAGVPHFYDPRAQAGLAPPRMRKRRRRYSSASSESYDSDEEREAERRRQIESISDQDWPLMLLRNPQEWVTTKTLQTMASAHKSSRPQNAPKQSDLSYTKKRKVSTSQMAARWARIKASNKPLSQSSNQPQTLQYTNITHSTQALQIRPPITQAPIQAQGGQAQVRRTTLGRAPRPPGTILALFMDTILEKFNKLLGDFQRPIEHWHLIHPEKADTVFHVGLRGEALLNNPKWNKGLAFTAEERKAFSLNGRLPSSVQTLDKQCQRAYQQFSSRESPVLKNSFLQSLKQQNWVLYYSLLARHLKEMMPIIYTPTEAEAIANYSHLFRRSEGLFLTYIDEEDMERAYLDQTRHRQIDLIVVSDAEAILGIGDQGVGGIGISTAKATVYSLIGGIDPSKALSVTLDVGTDNQNLLNEELYVGWQHKRVRGEDYDRFVDKFVQLVRKYNPHCLLHFEDFGVTNAQRLLEKYQAKHAVFNDDVQGTGAVTLACLMAAVGVTKSKLSDQRIVVFGAGTAGLGITRQIRDAMVTIDDITRDEANKKFYLIDKEGLIKASVQGGVRHGLEDFVRSDEEWEEVGTKSKVELLDVIRKVKPTVLIGCSTKAGAFTEEVVREMGKHVGRPIIFPLSNPSRLVEVDPKDANDWTEGRALLATGSPFPPTKNPNGKEYIIAECNNALIYPGLGLGAIVSKSRSMSDKMLLAGTQALASLAPALKDPDQALLPDFQDARRANFEVAVAVAEQAIDEGSAGVKWKKSEVREKVKAIQWEPVYGTYKYDPKGEV